ALLLLVERPVALAQRLRRWIAEAEDRQQDDTGQRQHDSGKHKPDERHEDPQNAHTQPDCEPLPSCGLHTWRPTLSPAALVPATQAARRLVSSQVTNRRGGRAVECAG